MPTAFMAAEVGDYNAFVSVYDPASDDATALLVQALSNADPASRAAIANRLLDDGADAATSEARATTINTLLGQVRHDVALEAPLLRRLIAGGADVNHREERGLLPIRQLVKIGVDGGDEGRRPLYEVLFAAPDLDLTLPSHPRKPEVSQRQQFEFPAWANFPVLLEHVRQWDERHTDHPGDSWLPEDWHHPVRVELATGHHLRPIRAADTDLDMLAVMGSRARLWSIYGRAWGWPPATMTAEQDREDLQRHADEIEAHQSFNYALFDADETELIGCVYIDPPEGDGADADISWWVRDEYVGSDVEAALDELVPAWIARDWPLTAPRYVFRDTDT